MGGDGGGDVRIFDTTLRDGEQAPGIALTRAEKVEIAEQLARLQVDIIEGGFPISSQGEFEAVRERVVVSTHCHNDLGLAVANSLAGIVNGARQVEVAVNGIGERAGNCSMEEI